MERSINMPHKFISLKDGQKVRLPRQIVIVIKFDKDKTDNVINIDIGSKEGMVVEVDGGEGGSEKKDCKNSSAKRQLEIVFSFTYIDDTQHKDVEKWEEGMKQQD